MLLSTLVAIILLQERYVRAVDLNGMFGRRVCFSNHQENCNEEFIDVYKNLSKSVTDLTDARTYFLLYTRKNQEEPEKLHKCAGRLPPNSNFNPRNRVLVLLLPYFFGYCDTAAFREWTVQLLKREDLNVIVVDYSWGNHFDYGTVVLNLKLIVRYQVLILLGNIQKQTGIKKRQIILLGHSLGAQLAGMVGGDFPVARIIGLDPAGPAFAEHETPAKDRLDIKDADLLEVWHCNAGDCLPNFGISYDAGHVNFYINGGTIQLSCYPHALFSLLRLDILYGIEGLLLPTACFHNHCLQYFKVSINPGNCQFVGVKCDNQTAFETGCCNSCGPKGENCLLMGWDMDKYITKIPRSPQRYYVRTAFQCPYCDNSHLELDGYSEIYDSSLQSL